MFKVERALGAVIGAGDIPVPCDSGYAVKLLYPVDGTLSGVVIPGGIGVVHKEVYSAYGGLLARDLLDILELLLVVLDVGQRGIVHDVVVM